MNQPLLLLAILTFCCCMSSLHGYHLNTCRCRKMSSTPIPARVVRKIEVTPISGHCRRTEIQITVRSGLKICVNPEAKWFPELVSTLQKKHAVSGSTTQPPTAFTANL